ncbi:YacL family protein, partial [Escherichia sp. S69_ASV_4]|nr:YacL family protein [Escherichia sp. S69_ASV_4]
MDYEFLRDITGVVKVRMSMGHEVVGHWFNAVSYTHLR